MDRGGLGPGGCRDLSTLLPTEAAEELGGPTPPSPRSDSTTPPFGAPSLFGGRRRRGGRLALLLRHQAGSHIGAVSAVFVGLGTVVGGRCRSLRRRGRWRVPRLGVGVGGGGLVAQRLTAPTDLPGLVGVEALVLRRALLGR